MNSNLIITAAGKSSRYPNTRPKYLLTHPDGKLMIAKSVEGLKLGGFSSIYVVLLKEHNEKWNYTHEIIRDINCVFGNIPVVVHTLDSTDSQPETVYKAIEELGIEGSIFIKDVDNYFELTGPVTSNEVCIFDLKSMSKVNAANKSYVTVNELGIIDNIVEKEIISSTFCCGGYSFSDAEQFKNYYLHWLDGKSNLYTSHVINAMLFDNVPLKTVSVKNYVDWGTLEDWQAYCSQYATLFLDLDGTLVYNAARPDWGKTNAISENVQKINELYNGGKHQIIITTARGEEYRDKTVEQLNTIGLKYHQIIFGLLHAKRIIVNDFADTNPYPSCSAINLERDSKCLNKYLKS